VVLRLGLRVGNCHGFMTRFESRGDHGCKEQWQTKGTRVYTGSCLSEDKNPTSSVHWCIIIGWGMTSTPLFIG
jgi:hypothetical protein